jgi:MoaA/NifB/PqqE/SkfB family radical SAM enzyme
MIKNAIIFFLDYLRTSAFKMRIKPRELQMPITSRCNSRCVTCNIWKDKCNVDIDPFALKIALEDPFFSKVRLVGLNGGEPSTYKQVDDLMNALLVLPKLNRIHVISNAIVASKLLDFMLVIKNRSREKNIKVYLTISLDGVGDIHDKERGVPNSFAKTLATLKTINADKNKYCDVLDIGTTISNININRIVEVEEFTSALGVKAYYHPAVPNKRLHNFDKEQSFDIMNNKRSLLIATEYFYGKFKYSRDLRTKIRSYITFYYLKNNGHRRLAGCNYLLSDITITENLDLCLCATASNKVGNLKVKSATELWKDGSMNMEMERIKCNCDECVHYIVFPTIKGFYMFFKELLKPTIWLKYKYITKWKRLLF